MCVHISHFKWKLKIVWLNSHWRCGPRGTLPSLIAKECSLLIAFVLHVLFLLIFAVVVVYDDALPWVHKNIMLFYVFSHLASVSKAIFHAQMHTTYVTETMHFAKHCTNGTEGAEVRFPFLSSLVLGRQFYFFRISLAVVFCYCCCDESS